MGGAIPLSLLVLVLALVALASITAISKGLRAQMQEARQAAAAGDEAVRSDLINRLREGLSSLRTILDEGQDRLDQNAAAVQGRLDKAEEGVHACQDYLAKAQAEITENAKSISADLKQAIQAAADTDRDHADRLAKLERQADEADHAVRDVQARLTALGDSLGALDTFVRDTLDNRLDSAMRAFNGTVTGVLGEMKGELLRGVGRIEEMEAVVAGRVQAQKRLVEGPDAALQHTGTSANDEAEHDTDEEQAEPDEPSVSDDAESEEPDSAPTSL